MILVIQYWSWMLLSLFFAWLSTRVKDKGVSILCSIISILIPSIIGGLREIGVGRDMLGYGIGTPMEVEASKSFWEFISDKKEIGYNILCYVITKTLGNVHWCFFAYQLITIACFYVGAYKHRKTASLPLTLMLFYCLFINRSYTIMRQCMAASILFMGLDSLEERKYKKFFIYILAAMSFHTSSIVTIVLVLGLHFIISRKSRFRYIISYLVLGLLAIARPVAYAIFSATDLVPTRYLGYVGSNYYFTAGYSFSNITLYVIELITLSVFSKSGRKVFGNYNFDYYRANLLVSLLFFLIGFFVRLIWFYEYINLLAMGTLPSLTKDKTTKFLMIIALVFAVSFIWYRTCVLYESQECWPYKSILKIY